jgi:hypothetical protein
MPISIWQVGLLFVFLLNVIKMFFQMIILFFLKGHESKIYDHLLKINAGKHLEATYGDFVITGQINSVENTKFDFRDFVRIGDRVSSDTKPEDGLIVYLIVNEANAVDKKSDFKCVAV